MKVLSNICATCLCSERRIEYVVDHRCHNYCEGVRKGMEETSGIELVKDINQRGLIAAYLVEYYDSLIRANLGHTFAVINEINVYLYS